MPSKGIGTEVTGRFQKGSPGFPGVLNCEANIWHNSPVYKRKLQDETYIFAPETVATLSKDFTEKIESIRGYDGLYLQPEYKYRHNFLATVKPESNNVITKNLYRGIEKATGIIHIDRLEFIDLKNENAVAAFLRKDPGGDPIPNAFASAEAAQHMWIDDGSLYISETFTQTQLKEPAPEGLSEIEKNKLDFRKLFYPRWEYILPNISPEGVPGDGTVSTRTENNVRHFPIQEKTSPGDPVQFLELLGLSDDPDFSVGEDNTYKDVNPGIHWRVKKRTPLFQGEDFWIEFRKMARETDISITKGSRFKMRTGLEYLDTNAQSTQNGEVQNQGIVDIGPNAQKIEESRKQFDFSDQSYYIIEIGVDDADHNYYIILSDRNNPVFCHAGKVYIREPNTEDTADAGGNEPDIVQPNDNNVQSNEGEIDCTANSTTGGSGNDSDSGGSSSRIILSKSKILRRLSTYAFVSSQTLMKQDTLRITVRQHLGRIIISFSGYEDNPWVIARQDLTEVPEPSDDPEGEENFVQEAIPMVIAAKPIILMGGNVKTSFHMAPLQYKTVESTSMRNRLSVEGPVDMDEIQLLLRDKGISRNPSIGTKTNKVQFTQEAELYREWIEDEYKETRAIEVMPNQVFDLGKAPLAQQRRRKIEDGASAISIAAKDCSKRLGSSAPFAKLVEITISIKPGNYTFTSPDPGADDNQEEWTANSCITPIMTGFRLFVPPKYEAFDTNTIDVGHHIMRLQTSWSENDLLTITHGGRITFLVNDGMDDRFKDGRPNRANYLRSLADKNFFIQIAVWWGENVDGPPASTKTGEIGQENSRFTEVIGRPIMPVPPYERDRIIFTGICTNSSITVENGKHVMTCDLKDYTKILEDQIFLNSPFFDKMSDFNAINEIIQMAGLRDGVDRTNDIGGLNSEITHIDNSQPASLVARLAASNKSGWFQIPHNGETTYNSEYALPGSYNILYEPLFRFQDGDSLWNGIRKISQMAGKIIYFDRLGVFHYEKLPYDQELFGGQQDPGPDFNIRKWEALSKINFFASPKDQLRSSDAESIHRQVFGDYTVTRDMDSVINQIRVISNTPDGTLLLAGHTNFDSLFDNEKPGFIGYPKTMLLMDGIYGDEHNVKWIVKHYTKLFLPPIKIEFKALGHNLLKALDIVTFQGLGWRDRQVLIIGDIENDIDPSSNTWWQTFSCYWIFPSQNVSWGSPNEINIGLDILGGSSQTA